MQSATLHAYVCHGVSSRYIGNRDEFQYRDAGSDSVLLHYGL